ncbi:MAG: hypothetical protein GYB65_12065 [Chloroflexi bacterium]|nr:hypothetical protein [Chloroflexota bacterium]
MYPTKDERIEMLEDARDTLDTAIDLIKQAVDGTGLDNLARAYIIPTLIMSARSDHAYLGSQTANIDELIDALETDDA